MARTVTGLLPAGLMLAVVALGARAAEITNPQWKTAPAPSAFSAVHPKDAGVGTVVLGCKLQADGSVSDCTVRSETPEGQGFAAAALRLAPLYRMAMPPAGYTQKDVDEGLTVPLTIAWRPSTISYPEWLTQPTLADIQRVFPDRAQRLGQEGAVMLQCTVTDEGTLEKCGVVGEVPAGRGFGDAALSLVPKFSLKPKTKDGAPVGGAKIRVPIEFRIR